MKKKFFKSLIALLSVGFVGVGTTSCLNLEDLEQKVKLILYLLEGLLRMTWLFEEH